MLACRVVSLHDETTVSRPWCMNRDRPATTPIERRFTDRCCTTALFAGRSSDSGRCTRGAPLLLVLLATWAGQTLTPSAGEAPVVGTVACQFRFVHHRRSCEAQ